MSRPPGERVCDKAGDMPDPAMGVRSDAAPSSYERPPSPREGLAVRIQRLVRFAIVGGVASLSYAMIAYLLVARMGVGQVAASAIAYIAALPISFLGQKFFTFRSRGAARVEAPRFLVLQGANLALASGVTAFFAHVLNAPAIYGIIAVCVAIPLSAYLAMSIAVFRKADRA